MSELSFIARACYVGALEDSDAFVIALADDAENPQQTFELQRAETGRTYTTVLTSGATFEGGIVSHQLTSESLTLQYSADAAQVLGLSTIRVQLDLDPLVIDQIRSGFQVLFS
ncbi:Imm10 family immunity protein [Deinococcus cellulosilyticus]|uniref:Uncharacterized protein n=1 Tax=Deinococcus cellulosilyticus (strain DSM 18568 / NBRC 106333 / KACC 11606 / 5516J-15) TaxID=1223518 RepID=A0A511N5D9_DEIC1|nr:Imm10 family immunity protein [Deinococcus cellulosilyticus]GEM48053.1 hypothetical protein DC3_36880 [Deinococcus cellulosilyticus NBRC 106333 = KACC 11606]